MSEILDSSGSDDLERSMREALAQRLKQPAPKSERVRKPLTPKQRLIIQGTHMRPIGHDVEGNRLTIEELEQDIEAIVAMNNSLVLDPQDLVQAPGEDAEVYGRRLQQLAALGWHVSPLIRDKIRELLQKGGYGFLVEFHDGTQTTPYGYQIGFPFMPRHMHNLSIASMPKILMFRNHEADTWTIWRTGIIRAIEDLRRDFLELGIDIAPALDGEKLQGNGAGVATKVVDASAAMELNQHRVQCNIGKLYRPEHQDDVIAENEVSMKSAGNVFDRTDFTRDHVDEICDANSHVIAEMCWRIFNAAPADMLKRARLSEGPLVRKQWDIERLIRAGVVLARILRNGNWKSVLSVEGK